MPLKSKLPSCRRGEQAGYCDWYRKVGATKRSEPFFNSASSSTLAHEIGSPHAKRLEGVSELPRHRKRQNASSFFLSVWFQPVRTPSRSCLCKEPTLYACVACAARG